MTTAASFVEFQRRQDLQTRQYAVGKRQVLAIKDPITLEYFHFSGVEQQMLDYLRQPRKLADLVAFCQTLPETQGVTEAELQPFLYRMLSDGLIHSNRVGAGQLLYKLARRKSWHTRLGAGLSLIAIRLPGLDPSWLLRMLRPLGTVLFAPLSIAAILLIALVTSLFFLVNAGELVYRLPTLSVFLQGSNLVTLMVTMACVKILHELGHALACQKFGGECHEIGIMLLAFFPCLYCNVSDAWMFPGKWQRLVVSSAGILVELLLASFSALAWFWTTPGTPNSLFFNIAITCSINTLLINGNPLLRYDGYYILSDLLNQPNLGSESRRVLWTPVRQLLFRGFSRRSLTWLSQPLLAIYGLASTVYRWFIVIAILWGIYWVAKINDVELLGQLVVVWTAVSLGVGPLLILRRGFRTGAYRLLRPLGVLLVGAGVGVAAWLTLTYPIPYQQSFPVVIEPAKVQPVYATVTGVLQDSVAAGSLIRQGDPIATLDNPTLRLQAIELEGRIKVAEQVIDDLRVRQVRDERVAQQIAIQETLLEDLNAQLDLAGQRLADLTILAPSDGLILVRRYRTGLRDESLQLNQWVGSPLADSNRRCLLVEGDEVCAVASPAGQVAVCFVRQNQLAFISAGQPVRLVVHQVAGKTLRGVVEEISPMRLDSIPETLLLAEELSAAPGETGQAQPVEPTYQVKIRILDPPYRLLNGSLGRARILVTSETLGERLVRSVQDNLAFKLKLGGASP